MIPLLKNELLISDESIEIRYDLTSFGLSIYDHHNIDGLHPFLHLIQSQGNKQISSNGLMGVVADGVPVSAKVVLIQEIDGLLFEVGSTLTEDGAWNVKQLNDLSTICIAIKEGYNTGTVSQVIPEG
ncbi:hypothetical protein [Acinetobacter bereziniae]|uniref:hypothetical protein n=1 Tax=Acinetobacter bereziniae TaxID=106648 RepID=UPI00300A4757